MNYNEINILPPSMISEKFTIEDIHLIRYENYEKTKNMKQEELIEKTRLDAEEGKKLLIELRNKFQKQVIKNI